MLARRLHVKERVVVLLTCRQTESAMDDSDLALLQSITLLKSFVEDLILLEAAHYRERIVVNRSLVEASMELVNRVLFTSRIDINDASVKNASDSCSALTL